MTTPCEAGVARALRILLTAVCVIVPYSTSATVDAQPAAPPQNTHGRLFPPQDLGLLEAPDRDAWQKPDVIMDALGIADGAVVADIGAGAGWFTIRLARRVGPNGTVYAQDVQRQMLEAIRRRVEREGLRNVQTRLGVGSLTNLPGSTLDAILVVDVYPEVEDRVTFLRSLAVSLKPGGRIGIVNYKPGKGGPGPDVRIDSMAVEADARAASLRVVARETLPYQYLLVLTQAGQGTVPQGRRARQGG